MRRGTADVVGAVHEPPLRLVRQNRRSIRLPGYDYSKNGAYFVTICTQNRECLFGTIVDGEMQLNQFGKIAADTWNWLRNQYNYVVLDQWVVMPNHLHGIIVINNDCRGGSRTAPTVNRKPLGRLIGAFKTVSTKHINQIRTTPGVRIWQRNYWEHIIRNDGDLNRIRQYIMDNPIKWETDRENLEAGESAAKINNNFEELGV